MSTHVRGLTFDTGALIAIDRNSSRMNRVLATVRRERLIITVPNVVLAEWWRAGFGKAKELLLRSFLIEPLSDRLAKVAGEAAGAVGATAVDAIVMASAASRGDYVYTSDMPDLQRLQRVFPVVRLFQA